MDRMTAGIWFTQLIPSILFILFILSKKSRKKSGMHQVHSAFALSSAAGFLPLPRFVCLVSFR
jgi:hypothetical protein